MYNKEWINATYTIPIEYIIYNWTRRDRLKMGTKLSPENCIEIKLSTLGILLLMDLHFIRNAHKILRYIHNN